MLGIVSKEIRINVRTSETVKEELEITAKLRGLTVSSLVNSLVVQAIREEKQREPKAFTKIEVIPVENLGGLVNAVNNAQPIDEIKSNKRKIS